MILAFIFIVIALCFFFVAGIMWESGEKNTTFIIGISGILVMLFGFVIFFFSVRDDARTETKEITLQLLEKDNKVDIQINVQNYNSLFYKLTDSTLTNTFDYLRSNK